MSKLSRRNLFSSAVLLAAAAILPSDGLLARPPEDADPGAIGANGAVAKALNATSFLISGGSAGLRQLGSTSEAGRYTVAAQLKTLLDAIASAQARAAALTDSRPYLQLRFPAATAGITAATTRYVEYIGAGTDQAALAPIRDQIAVERRALSALPEGKGIEAAILVPLAFAAEYGAALRTITDKEALRAIREQYRLWITSMRDMTDGTIPFRRLAAEVSHDGQLNATAGSHFGRRLGIGNFVLGGTQAEKKIGDPCVIIATQYLSFSPDGRGGVTRPQTSSVAIWTNFTPNVLVGFSDIKVRDNELLGVRLIRFHPGSGMNYALSFGFVFHPGIGDEYCYVAKSNSELSSAAAFTRAETLDGFKEDRANRTKIIAAINNANACRIEIALSGRALTMLEAFAGILEYHGHPS